MILLAGLLEDHRPNAFSKTRRLLPMKMKKQHNERLFTTAIS